MVCLCVRVSVVGVENVSEGVWSGCASGVIMSQH